MIVDIQILFHDVAARKLIETKVNKPNIACYKDCDKYTKIFTRKTRNRKHVGSIVALGEVFVYGNTTYIPNPVSIYPINLFENDDDPVSLLVRLERTRYTKKVQRIITRHQETPEIKAAKIIGKNYVIGSTEGLKLVSRDKVPPNAVLVSIDPLYWLQIGRGRLLLTRGAVWLDEDISEFDSEYIIVQKTGDHYKVRLWLNEVHTKDRDFIKLPNGIFKVYPGETPVGARMIFNRDKNLYDDEKILVAKYYKYVMGYMSTVTITIENDKVLLQEQNHYFNDWVGLEDITTFEEVWFDGKRYYVPKIYVG